MKASSFWATLFLPSFRSALSELWTPAKWVYTEVWFAEVLEGADIL